MRYDGGHGKDDVKKRTGIGTGCMVSTSGAGGRNRVADASLDQGASGFVTRKNRHLPAKIYARYRHVICLMRFFVHNVIFGKRIL